jgi:hypothetical protein
MENVNFNFFAYWILKVYSVIMLGPNVQEVSYNVHEAAKSLLLNLI